MRGQLREQRGPRARVSAQHRQTWPDRPQQASRKADGGLEERPFPTTPEATGIKRDDVADAAAPGEFEHDARAHGAADDVDPRQPVVRNVAFNAADKTVEGPAVVFRRGGTMAGKVDRDHRSAGAECIQDGAPRSPTSAKTVYEQQLAAGAALNLVHIVLPSLP